MYTFKTKLGISLLILLALITGGSYAQSVKSPSLNSGSLEKTLIAFQKKVAEFPFEKVYLHLNKPYYAAGDTIWFKGYVVQGNQKLLSGISAVLNAELINGRNQIIRSIKLPIIGGLSMGDFVLPDTLKQGDYRVRAYTNWMRNAGSEYFFDQQIAIINTALPTANTKKAALKNEANIQFFPEGGYLVNGSASKVAFKAVGANGLGIGVKGIILDEQNNEINKLTSTHLGMGSFMLAPQNGKTYKAKLTYDNGYTQLVKLPAANDKGQVLSVNNTDPANITVKVISVNTGEELTLVAQAGGEIIYQGKSSPVKAMFLANIPKNKFPTGIAKLTLFSSAGEPLNERSVFIQNPDQLQLKVNTLQASYLPRQMVKVELNATGNGLPVAGNFSATVINETEIPVDETIEGSILANLLFTSDLKGYVEKPNYYFDNPNNQSRANLDLLMLTQGYSRFEWKKINDEAPIIYQAEKSLTISGRLVTSGNKPIVNGKLNLISPTGGALLDTLTDQYGRFAFTDLAFKDSTFMIIKASAANGRTGNVKIILDKIPAVDNTWATPLTNGEIPEKLSSYMVTQKKLEEEKLKYGLISRSILLSEVNIYKARTKSERKLEEEDAVKNSSNLNGKGQANQVFTADDIEQIGGGTLLDRLTGRIAGVTMSMTGGVLLPYMNRASSQNPVGPPLPMQVVINGMFQGGPVEGVEAMNMLPISEIASVEVLRSGNYLTIYGSRGSAGVIVVTTKRGLDETLKQYKAAMLKSTPEVANFEAQGYYKFREFYSPRYTPGQPAGKPDLRTAISWNPIIQTDNNGNASFEYFNADTKGTYRILVEGIDNLGRLGRQIYRYKVE